LFRHLLTGYHSEPYAKNLRIENPTSESDMNRTFLLSSAALFALAAHSQPTPKSQVPFYRLRLPHRRLLKARHSLID